MKPDDKGTPREAEDEFDFRSTTVVPTLPAAIDSLKPQRTIQRHANEDAKAVERRIRKDSGLCAKLAKLGADPSKRSNPLLKSLSHLIALNIHHSINYRYSRDELERAKDHAEKTERRIEEIKEKTSKYSHKKRRSRLQSREGRVSVLAKVSARHLFARDALLSDGTKAAYYYPYLIFSLHKVLTGGSRQKEGERIQTLMAGLLNRFNLRAESFCQNRTGRNKVGRRGDFVTPTGKGCSKFDPKKGQCSLVNIFDCPWHKETRKAVSEYLISLRKRMDAGKPAPSSTYKEFKPHKK